MKTSWLVAGGLAMGLWMSGSISASAAEESAPSSAAPTSTDTTSEAGKNEWYVSLFMQGSLPLNRPIRLLDDPMHNTDVRGGLGGGLKVGLFPALTGGFLGVEAELSGLDGKVNAPPSTKGATTQSGNFRLQSVNMMANLLLRYPGDVLQPYVGIGAGISGGFARDLNLARTGMNSIHENAADGAFAYQFIGGLRANLSDSWFLFSEYKYFVANYQWESEYSNGSHGPSFTLNYRAHIVSGGVGFQF